LRSLNCHIGTEFKIAGLIVAAGVEDRAQAAVSMNKRLLWPTCVACCFKKTKMKQRLGGGTLVDKFAIDL